MCFLSSKVAVGVRPKRTLPFELLVSGCNRLSKYKIDFDMCEIERQFNRNNFLYNDKIEDAQAPGDPTKNDGFIPNGYENIVPGGRIRGQNERK